MLKRKIPLAWLQLIRQKGRFGVALCGIAFANILILMQLGFQDALFNSNTRLHQLLLTDVVIVSSTAQNLGLAGTFPRRRLFQATNVPGVETADPLYVRSATWQNPQTKLDASIFVIGFNPARPAFNLLEVNQNLALIQYPDTVFFDRGTRGNYAEAIAQIEQGRLVTTEIEERRIKIRGLYEIGASFAAEGSIMTSDQNFLRIFDSQQQAGQVTVGLIRLKPRSDLNAVTNALRSYLPNDVMVMTRAEFIAFERNYWETNTAIGFTYALGVFLSFVVGVIIVYQIIYSDVADHLSEYATLKAMGYRSLYLLGVILQESLILAVMGFTPGCLISNFLYDLTRGATNLPLFLTTARATEVLILTIAMCFISGTLASRKLRSADPAEIF